MDKILALKNRNLLKNLYNNHLDLGNLYFKINKFYNAIYHYHCALTINKNSNKLFLRIFNLFCLLKIKNQKNQFLKNICLFYLKQNSVYHNLMFHNAFQFTKFFELKKEKKNLKIFNNFLSEKLIRVCNDEILQLILKKCLVRNIELESFLKKIRVSLLEIYFVKKKEIKKIYSFLISLAEQCFFNEYVYETTTRENILIKKLEKKILNDYEFCELSFLILTLYQEPIKSKGINNKLKNYKSDSFEFNQFLVFTYKNQIIENKIKSDFSNQKIKDRCSKLIKSQYEENPYPRWRFTSFPMDQTFQSFIKSKNLSINNHLKQTNYEILIAGCGTGHQVVQYSGIRNSNICAIDLSSSSLSFAKRTTNELEIKNVNYFNLDILDINLLNKKFDFIICSGCLHHMKKPEEGLESLLNVLNNDGILYIGLYSEIARTEIYWIRQYIKKYLIKVSKENMIKLRKKMLKSSNKNFKEITKSIDFFSFSRFRDLVFNFQEHNFNIHQLKNIFEKYKLTFLGFDRLNSIVMQRFKKRFPCVNSEYDLNCWNEFEKDNPKTFTSMYNIWLKKN